MKDEQRIFWNKEYRLRGKLWRGESKEKEIIESGLRAGLSLDVGCGNGKESPSGNEVIGMDFSIFALRNYPNERKILGDMRAIPFKRESFSNVLLLHSLDHLLLTDREKAIDEAWRILKDDGLLVIRVFSTDDFRSGKGKEVESGTLQRGTKIITHYFERQELEKYRNFSEENFFKINYYINIQNKKIKREEYIIILSKCKSQKCQ